MRIPFLGLVICALGALPAAAQTPRAAWEERMATLAQVSANAPLCMITGYTVSEQDVLAAAMQAVADAPKSGLTTTEAEAYGLTQMTLARAEAEPYTANFKHPDDDVAFRAINHAFTRAATVCKRLSEASPHMKPGPFQTSGRAQTYQDYMEFRAETGTADDMISAVDFYEIGYFPDPGFSKRIALSRRASEKRHPKAAFYLMSYYAVGDGVEKSLEKSLMWGVIGDTLGSADATEMLPVIRQDMTPTEIARAEAEAAAWLKAH